MSMQLPTREQCIELLNAALPGFDPEKYEKIYSVECEQAVFYVYAIGHETQTDFAIKICRHYGSFHAGMKRRMESDWHIVVFDVVSFSRVASEMLKNWNWS